MKKIIQLYVLPLFFSVFLIFPFSADSQEQAIVPHLASPANQSQPLSSEPPYDQKLKSLPEITTVATAAIHAAEHSVDVMLSVITAVGVLIVLMGLWGVTSLRAEMKKGMEEEIGKLKVTTEEVNTEAETTRNQLKILNCEAGKLTEEVNNRRVTIQEVGRSMVFVAKVMQLWQEAELLAGAQENNETRIRCLRDAISSLRSVGNSANKSDNIPLVAWSHSMRAYIYKRLGELDAAINDGEMAIKIAIDFIQQKKAAPDKDTSDDDQMAKDLEDTLSTKYYNLASYYCLKGIKDKWMSNLKKAVERDPQYKIKARTEEDFRHVWEDTDFKHLTD